MTTAKPPVGSEVRSNVSQEEELSRIQANREAEAIREKERIEAAVAAERQAKYQEEREKIRKLKMGMKKEHERKSIENDDNEVHVPPTKPSAAAADVEVSNRRIIRRSESDMESPARYIEEGPRRNSSNSNSPAMSRPKSLAELQAEKFKSNFPDINPVPVVTPVPLSNYYQNNGAGGGRMVVHRDVNNAPNNDEYESIARREFFANRAAAMKVKAKVDAMERGIPAPSSAREEKQQQLQQQHNEVDIDPEQRIAAIKAQKERQKEEALELREKQLQLAHEANRLQRKQAEKAVAFEIILDNEGGDGSSRNGRNKSENGINELQTMLPKPRKQWGPPPDQDELQQISSQESSPRAGGDSDVATAEVERANEKNVLKRLEGIQDQHTQARQKAKEIFRLLRDKRKATSLKSTGSNNQGSVKPTRHSTALAKNNKSAAINMNANELNIVGVSPIKRTIPKTRPSDEEDSKDFKDYKSADSKDVVPDISPVPQEMREDEKGAPPSVLLHNVTKSEKGTPDDLVYSDDSELEENIDTWLLDQKRNVTERKKREPKVIVNDSAIDRIPNNAIDYDFDGEGEEDDGDLYGLQCQLAQALLTQDDDEDHDIDDVLHYFR